MRKHLTFWKRVSLQGKEWKNYCSSFIEDRLTLRGTWWQHILKKMLFLGANDSTQNYLRVYVLGIILALLFCLKFLFDAINPIWEEQKIKSFSLILIGKGWCSDDSLLLIGTWAHAGLFPFPIRRFKRRKIRNRNEKSFGQNEIHRLQGPKWNHYRISQGRAIWFIKWSDAGIMG